MCDQTAAAEKSEEDALIEALGDNASHRDHNYRLGVAAGAFAGMARNFLNPELILVGLVYLLTDSAVLAALIPVISKLGILAPQLFISTFIEDAPRRKPHFLLATMVRGSAMVGLAGSIWLLTRQVSTVTLAVFYLAYVALCVSSAGAGVVFSDMVGRLIPPDRVGSFFGARRLVGGGLGVLAGILVIQPILNRVEVPDSYLILAVLGAVFGIVDMWIWCRTREEPGPSAGENSAFGEALRRGAGWLRKDHNYRCYLLSRIAFRVNYLGLAFFIPYGSERLAYEEPGGVAILGGLMVATLKASSILGAVLWGKVSDTFGSKAGLFGSGLLLVSAPVLALAAPRLPGVFAFTPPGVEGAFDLPMCVFLVALACMGTGLSGTATSGKRFLITNAPAERRPSYVGFLNTVTSPLALLPLAGAFVAELVGMDALFMVVVAGGLLSVLAAVLMRWDRTAEGSPNAVRPEPSEG